MPFINHKRNNNVVHDIITRDANSVSWAEISEFLKSQRDTTDVVMILKIIVLTLVAMLLIILQTNLNFQFNNNPIWPPN